MDDAELPLSIAERGSQGTDEEFWSLKVVRTKTGLSRSTIYSYVANGAFPAQRRLGPRRIAWRASEVKASILSLSSRTQRGPPIGAQS